MLHLVTTGNQVQRALLFLHGFMGAAVDWTRVIAGMGSTCRCLAVDLPGHGASTSLSEDIYTIQGTAWAILDVLDKHNIEHCDVVGYSMGGRLALYLAVYFPERFGQVVLESASPGLATEKERAARRVVDEGRAKRLEQEGLVPFLKEWYRQPLFTSLVGHAGLIEQLIARRRLNDPHELARSLRGMGTGSQPSLWERLAALQVPTMVLAGARDAKYVDLAGQMARRSSQIHVDIVPEAGHNIHVEQPHRYITLLHTYLKQT